MKTIKFEHEDVKAEGEVVGEEELVTKEIKDLIERFMLYYTDDEEVYAKPESVHFSATYKSKNAPFSKTHYKEQTYIRIEANVYFPQRYGSCWISMPSLDWDIDNVHLYDEGIAICLNETILVKEKEIPLSWLFFVQTGDPFWLSVESY